jgi:hypothetical protein
MSALQGGSNPECHVPHESVTDGVKLYTTCAAEPLRLSNDHLVFTPKGIVTGMQACGASLLWQLIWLLRWCWLLVVFGSCCGCSVLYGSHTTPSRPHSITVSHHITSHHITHTHTHTHNTTPFILYYSLEPMRTCLLCWICPSFYGFALSCLLVSSCVSPFTGSSCLVLPFLVFGFVLRVSSSHLLSRPPPTYPPPSHAHAYAQCKAWLLEMSCTEMSKSRSCAL